MRVLAVGIATLDIINTLAAYPAEDDEVRASSQRRARGGNATNTLVILSQQGHQCSWAGVLPRESDAELVLSDLARHHIQHDLCSRPAQGKLPTSYINISQATGSRTIVHYRDMPEYSFEAFERIDLGAFDWVHFEGRAVAELAPMLEKTAGSPGVGCSLEVEKPRTGIEELLHLPDIVLFSRSYVLSRGFDQAIDFLRGLGDCPGERHVAWGSSGAWGMDSSGKIVHSPAFPPPVVRDTLGAGDVFNAGVIHSHMDGGSVLQNLTHGCRLAGYKCGITGFEGKKLV